MFSKGMARGMRRYQCKACKKTFNAATGTALQGLHKKGKCLAFGNCLAEGMTVKGCRRSRSPPHFVGDIGFWAHMTITLWALSRLESYILESRKGERNLTGFRCWFRAVDRSIFLFFHRTTYKPFLNP